MCVFLFVFVFWCLCFLCRLFLHCMKNVCVDTCNSIWIHVKRCSVNIFTYNPCTHQQMCSSCYLDVHFPYHTLSSWPWVYSKSHRAPLVWPSALWKVLYLCIFYFPSPWGFLVLIWMKYIKRKINVGDLLEDSRTCRRASLGKPSKGAADVESIKRVTVNCSVFLYLRSQGCNLEPLRPLCFMNYSELEPFP